MCVEVLVTSVGGGGGSVGPGTGVKDGEETREKAT